MPSATEFEDLLAVFPARVVSGPVVPHECEECATIRGTLTGRTWREVADSFAEEFSGSLPLLTEDAYHAYLPVWLRAALTEPSGEAASMLLINLADNPPKTHFNQQQADAVIQVARPVVRRSYWALKTKATQQALKQ